MARAMKANSTTTNAGCASSNAIRLKKYGTLIGGKGVRVKAGTMAPTSAVRVFAKHVGDFTAASPCQRSLFQREERNVAVNEVVTIGTNG